MPELPEVETLRKYLVPHIVGATIESITVLNDKSFIGNTKDILGYKINALSRQGKIMHWELQKNKDIKYINIHLKMSGQLSHTQTKHTRVMFEFGGGKKLFFNDTRKFGWVQVTTTPLVNRGVDVTDKDFTFEYFAAKASNRQIPALSFLLDQNAMAGIGNIYANDALWLAGVHPLKKTNQLTLVELKKLYNAAKQAITDGIKHKGSSKTWVYRMPDGTQGAYQNNFKVYSRGGKACYNCGSILIKANLKGRGYVWCSVCQKV